MNFKNLKIINVQSHKLMYSNSFYNIEIYKNIENVSMKIYNKKTKETRYLNDYICEDVNLKKIINISKQYFDMIKK